LCQEWFLKTFGHHQKLATLFKPFQFWSKKYKRKKEDEKTPKIENPKE